MAASLHPYTLTYLAWPHMPCPTDGVLILFHRGAFSTDDLPQGGSPVAWLLLCWQESIIGRLDQT